MDYIKYVGGFLCCSYHKFFFYNLYVNQQTHSIKYNKIQIINYSPLRQLLHVLATECHPKGVHLNKQTNKTQRANPGTDRPHCCYIAVVSEDCGIMFVNIVCYRIFMF
jgi:hypothetical protein